MSGRDERGRFAKGNRAAAKENGGNGGRPSREIEERNIAIVRGTITPEDLRTITLTAIARAKAGDSVARQWVSDWALGKVTEKQEQDVQQTITLLVKGIDFESKFGTGL